MPDPTILPENVAAAIYGADPDLAAWIDNGTLGRALAPFLCPPYDHADCDHGCLLGDPACPMAPRHPGATLTGGTIPPHVPGSYPSLSCCGGHVTLVPSEPETDAREDAVCPTHGPNLYACPDGCAFAAAFPVSPHEATHGVPIVSDGPGWGMLSDDKAPAEPDPDMGEALLFADYRGNDPNTDTVAELYIVARAFGGGGFRYEAGAELTLTDLAHTVATLCEIGSTAATADDRHFFAEAFDRAREHIDRVMADSRA
jgi:hypothetical protein